MVQILTKIYEELVLIRRELQTIRNSLELKPEDEGEINWEVEKTPLSVGFIDEGHI